jgi:tetratricopeptide (TPR) repeat protein
MSVVYELQPYAPRPRRRLPRGAFLSALVFVVLLGWTPEERSASERDLPEQAAVGAGARSDELEDGSKISELAAPQLLAAHVERQGEAVVLSFDLDRAVPHWLERDHGRYELELVLDTVRLAQPLEWLDFAGTPIRYLDIRRVGEALHLVIGLDTERAIDVQSAMLELSAGAKLMLQLVVRQPSADAAPAAPLVSKRKLDSSAEDAYREALRLERAGEKRQAHERLRTLLAAHPEHEAARLRLAEGLGASGHAPEALRVLRAGTILPEDPARAKLEARLLVEQHAEAEAIAVLEGAFAQTSGDAEYGAFLAGLLQRTGEHERATTLFRAALAEEPSRAAWWLGLAVSEDARGERSAARASFERALVLGGLDAEARAWAEARARALAAEGAEKSEANP